MLNKNPPQQYEVIHYYWVHWYQYYTEWGTNGEYNSTTYGSLYSEST